jgi:hypothetical protein
MQVAVRTTLPPTASAADEEEARPRAARARHRDGHGPRSSCRGCATWALRFSDGTVWHGHPERISHTAKYGQQSTFLRRDGRVRWVCKVKFTGLTQNLQVDPAVLTENPYKSIRVDPNSGSTLWISGSRWVTHSSEEVQKYGRYEWLGRPSPATTRVAGVAHMIRAFFAPGHGR